MDSKLSLVEILRLMLKFSEETLVLTTSADLTLDKNTVSKWFAVFRSALAKSLEESAEKIGGEGRVVQIDETVIARRKYNRGRIVPQQWLFGAIDTVNSHYILRCIDNRSKVVLKKIIVDTITENSTIHSDMWSSYMSIFSEDLGFVHETVNHSENFKDPVTGVHTNLIENLWMLLKQALRRKYQRSRAHLELYLAEFCMRSKYKKDNMMFFYALCEAIKLL